MRMFAPGLLAAALLLCGLSIASADCECRANSRMYRHGELACLRLPTGEQLARCDMVLNNSAWMKVSDGCPEASADNLGQQTDDNPSGSQPSLGGDSRSPTAGTTRS